MILLLAAPCRHKLLTWQYYIYHFDVASIHSHMMYTYAIPYAVRQLIFLYPFSSKSLNFNCVCMWKRILRKLETLKSACCYSQSPVLHTTHIGARKIKEWNRAESLVFFVVLLLLLLSLVICVLHTPLITSYFLECSSTLHRLRALKGDIDSWQ